MKSNFKFGILLVKKTSNQLLDHTSEGNLIRAIGAILVFDVTNRQSFENVSNWLSEISAQTSTNIVIVLVGNKIDRITELVEKKNSNRK